MSFNNIQIIKKEDKKHEHISKEQTGKNRINNKMVDRISHINNNIKCLSLLQFEYEMSLTGSCIEGWVPTGRPILRGDGNVRRWGLIEGSRSWGIFEGCFLPWPLPVILCFPTATRLAALLFYTLSDLMFCFTMNQQQWSQHIME
jgi:hypothetical protein